jgi:UDP-N-acetyl-D-galactosamine dehydrogenase
VDPYYLTYKAEKVGYHPEVILAGRRINDNMGKFVAEQTVKHLVRNGWMIKDAPIVVLGLTFKEDCPDLRNSRVIDVITELQSYGARVYVHDPIADPREAHHEYGVELVKWDDLPKAAALVAAVSHKEYKAQPLQGCLDKLQPNGVVADVKSRFPLDAFDGTGITLWRL